MPFTEAEDKLLMSLIAGKDLNQIKWSEI